MDHIIIVAAGAGQLKELAGIAGEHALAVFGTMDRAALGRIPAQPEPGTPVYFYKTG